MPEQRNINRPRSSSQENNQSQPGDKNVSAKGLEQNDALDSAFKELSNDAKIRIGNTKDLIHGSESNLATRKAELGDSGFFAWASGHSAAIKADISATEKFIAAQNSQLNEENKNFKESQNLFRESKKQTKLSTHLELAGDLEGAKKAREASQSALDKSLSLLETITGPSEIRGASALNASINQNREVLSQVDSNLQNTETVIRGIRNTSLVVGATVATGGLAAGVVGGSVVLTGGAVAASTGTVVGISGIAVGSNYLEAVGHVAYGNKTSGDAYRDAANASVKDVKQVAIAGVSGAVGGGVAGALGKGVTAATGILPKIGVGAAAGATGAVTGTTLGVADRYNEAVNDFNQNHAGKSEVQKAEIWQQYKENYKLTTKDVALEFAVASSAGAIGGAIGGGAGIASQGANSSTQLIGIKSAELVADTAAGIGTAKVQAGLEGREMTFADVSQAITDTIAGSGLGNVSAKSLESSNVTPRVAENENLNRPSAVLSPEDELFHSTYDRGYRSIEGDRRPLVERHGTAYDELALVGAGVSMPAPFLSDAINGDSYIANSQNRSETGYKNATGEESSGYIANSAIPTPVQPAQKSFSGGSDSTSNNLTTTRIDKYHNDSTRPKVETEPESSTSSQADVPEVENISTIDSEFNDGSLKDNQELQQPELSAEARSAQILDFIAENFGESPVRIRANEIPHNNLLFKYWRSSVAPYIPDSAFTLRFMDQTQKREFIRQETKNYKESNISEEPTASVQKNPKTTNSTFPGFVELDSIFNPGEVDPLYDVGNNIVKFVGVGKVNEATGVEDSYVLLFDEATYPEHSTARKSLIDISEKLEEENPDVYLKFQSLGYISAKLAVVDGTRHVEKLILSNPMGENPIRASTEQQAITLINYLKDKNVQFSAEATVVINAEEPHQREVFIDAFLTENE